VRNILKEKWKRNRNERKKKKDREIGDQGRENN